MTAAFSAKIRARVSPSTSVCSSAMLVSTTTGAFTTLVASRRPPSPASRATASTPLSREREQSGDGEHLELRRLTEPAGQRRDLFAHALDGARRTPASSTGRPSTMTRSVQPEMCGER